MQPWSSFRRSALPFFHLSHSISRNERSWFGQKDHDAPKKGNLNGALEGEVCARTGKKVMILWAFELRIKQPAVLLDGVADGPDEDDQDLYHQAVNDQHEEAEFVDYEDEVHNGEAQRKDGIEEVYGDKDDDD
jgi:hypothetical protein